MNSEERRVKKQSSTLVNPIANVVLATRIHKSNVPADLRSAGIWY